jgi:hypothetical protein
MAGAFDIRQKKDRSTRTFERAAGSERIVVANLVLRGTQPRENNIDRM